MGKNKKFAKYEIIENDILKQILDGKLKVGDQITPETILCEEYGVSRMTANKAIQSLTAKGYIRRVTGKGSFVCNPHVSKMMNSSRSRSFSDDMRSIGLVPGARLIQYCIYRGEDIPGIAEILKAEPDDMIHFFSRVRTGDGEPISISYTYVPCKLLNAIEVQCLENSFYEYVQAQLGLIPTCYDYTISATMPTSEQRELLGVGNEALLKVTHPTYMENGDIFEYTETFYIGSRYTYSFHL